MSNNADWRQARQVKVRDWERLAGLAEVYRGDYPAAGLDLNPYWQAEEEARKARIGM